MSLEEEEKDGDPNAVELRLFQLHDLLSKLPDVIHWHLMEMIFPLPFIRHHTVMWSSCGQESLEVSCCCSEEL